MLVSPCLFKASCLAVVECATLNCYRVVLCCSVIFQSWIALEMFGLFLVIVFKQMSLPSHYCIVFNNAHFSTSTILCLLNLRIGYVNKLVHLWSRVAVIHTMYSVAIVPNICVILTFCYLRFIVPTRKQGHGPSPPFYTTIPILSSILHNLAA